MKRASPRSEESDEFHHVAQLKSADVGSAAAASLLLYGRARHGAERTIYAAVTWLGAQQGLAAQALVKILAGVSWHRLKGVAVNERLTIGLLAKATEPLSFGSGVQ